MKLLTKKSFRERFNAGSDPLVIEPLLDEGQLGEISIDLRLGYDFYVSIYSKNPVITLQPEHAHLEGYFQPTRRDLGDSFILYPHQSVLTTSLEYVALPADVMLELTARSSYARLGVHIGAMVQPGFRGCVPLELYNHSNNILSLVVGARIFQARLYDIECQTEYSASPRKYSVHVRPQISKAWQDKDLAILHRCTASPNP